MVFSGFAAHPEPVGFGLALLRTNLGGIRFLSSGFVAIQGHGDRTPRLP